MENTPIRIEQPDPQWLVLWNFWNVQGRPTQLEHGRYSYLVLKENDKMVFVLTGGSQGPGNMYDSSSFQKMG
jgi:hypothetical protein